MISQADKRLLTLMIEKCDRLIEICDKHTLEEIETNFIYSDAIQFEFEKLYEDSTRISSDLRINYKELHIDSLRAIRNRVAHDYESVSLKILIDTIKEDIPGIKKLLNDFLESQK